MKKDNTLPLQILLWSILILSIIFCWINRPIKDHPVLSGSGISSGAQTRKAVELSANPLPGTHINPINPIRTDKQILENIAQQNENHNKLNALLSAQAQKTAQIRQQAEITKYQKVDTETIPAPDTSPDPDDIMAKLKSGELIHH